jgi:hypothetical protein
MNDNPLSKLDDYEPFQQASFDRPCSRKTATGQLRVSFRLAENGSGGIAGNASPTVHTAPAFDPTAQEAAL